MPNRELRTQAEQYRDYGALMDAASQQPDPSTEHFQTAATLLNKPYRNAIGTGEPVATLLTTFQQTLKNAMDTATVVPENVITLANAAAGHIVVATRLSGQVRSLAGAIEANQMIGLYGDAVSGAVRELIRFTPDSFRELDPQAMIEAEAEGQPFDAFEAFHHLFDCRSNFNLDTDGYIRPVGASARHIPSDSRVDIAPEVESARNLTGIYRYVHAAAVMQRLQQLPEQNIWDHLLTLSALVGRTAHHTGSLRGSLAGLDTDAPMANTDEVRQFANYASLMADTFYTDQQKQRLNPVNGVDLGHLVKAVLNEKMSHRQM